MKRLIQLIIEETGIPYTHFGNQVNFMAISLLRAFIQHSSSTKTVIMQDSSGTKGPGKKTVTKSMIQRINPDNLHKINKDIENAILSLLTQIVKEETDYKRTIGD